MGWGLAPHPGRLYPKKNPVPILQEAGWAPGPVWYCNMNGIKLGCLMSEGQYGVEMGILLFSNAGFVFG